MIKSFLGSFILLLLLLGLIVSGYAINERMEKDATGREWVLKNWEDGTRPYPKDIKERKLWYKKKWGENWFGPINGRRIHNPGEWRWEVVVTLPSSLVEKLRVVSKKKVSPWGRKRVTCLIWAPGGGDVTDIYALTLNGIYHFDPGSGVHTFIGRPDESGLRDGTSGTSLLRKPGISATLDPVTGRIYFIQGNVLRYIEKLLPYQCLSDGKVCYLPAVLDWNELYRNIKSPFGGKLKPAIKDGRRGAPLFVVRSNPAVKTLRIPGAKMGKRPLITPDGKGVYFSSGSPGKPWYIYTFYETTALFNIDTGRLIEKLKLQGDVPWNNWNGKHRWTADGPGSHGGNNVGYDGKIYTAQHGGAGGGPGRMFSIDPKTGVITMLYDSMPEDGTWRKRRSSIIDGPADAKSLDFTSTLWQVQSPRTGAIINGGWDNSGIRRYHDGFLTTVAGHNYGAFWKPARPGWTMGFKNVHGNNNPSIAPNGDLYLADTNNNVPRIIRIYRTDWPKEQPLNGYAEKFFPKERMKALMLEYAEKYIKNYAENNRLLEVLGK